eukprot:3623166-Ditylum_brightwellii.AAC.1
MLLRVPISMVPLSQEGEPAPPSTLMECILTYIEYASSHSGEDVAILTSMLRFLSEWIPNSSIVISALLSCHCSTTLGVILKKPPSTSAQALTGLLLGLCMESMEDEGDYSGWNRESIMGLITGLGVGKFTSLLERLKKSKKNEDLPWFSSDLESQTFGLWFAENVNVVRRRMVKELAGGASGDDSEESDGESKEGSTMPRNESFASGSDASGGKKKKVLSKLLSQQSLELENLREALEKSEKLAAKQASELKMWKRRMESNPTQLDEMMTEFTEKNAALEMSNEALKGDMQKTEENHQSALEEKEKTIQELQTELQD